MKTRNLLYRVVTIIMLLFLLLLVSLSSAIGPIWFAAMAASSLATSGPADSPWPMYQHDSRRTSQSPFVGPYEPYLKWHHSILPGSSSTPTIAPDGTIYVGSNNNRLYAIESDGTLKWTYEVPNVIWSSSAVADDGTIYVGHNGYSNGNLLAINPDGTLKWSYPAREVRSSPAIAPDGTIFVGASDARLYAINPDGSLKWVYQTGFQESYSSPAIGADGTIYIAGAKDGNLHAVNPDGTTKWTYPLGNLWSAISSPVIDRNDTIYIGGCDTKLYAVNSDGTLKWSYNVGSVGGSERQSAAVGPDGTVYIISRDRILYAFTPNGDLKWTYTITNTEDFFTTPTIDANGVIYFGAHNGKVYAINPDGSEKWTFQTPAARLASSIAINSDGTLYVAGTEGVYAVGAAVGVVQAEVDIDPDTVNLKSSGKWVTVYIELSAGYDVADIVLETVCLDNIQAITDPKYGFVTDPGFYLIDHDEDGILERMAKFDRATVVDYSGTIGVDDDGSGIDRKVELTITGELIDGTPFVGTDTIRVIEKGK